LFWPGPQVRAELEQTFNQDLTVYKKFIDEKMMVILGQMEQSRCGACAQFASVGQWGSRI
jgi:hypothetical protein